MEKCVCGSSSHEGYECPQCHGKGRKVGLISNDKCSHCHGLGKLCPKK